MPAPGSGENSNPEAGPTVKQILRDLQHESPEGCFPFPLGPPHHCPHPLNPQSAPAQPAEASRAQPCSPLSVLPGGLTRRRGR
ncbi:hypothetical protein MANAM107_08070 [Actinomyces capricornis]|uniref:Uncharacterized protein n=1 Tax=Actinomyces capricornis TaxID=2755559 RepID=A0ABN6K3P5_9ACTO|nr:hypothetical protein MANAM107_08070 [Actinomyces capricornis]